MLINTVFFLLLFPHKSTIIFRNNSLAAEKPTNLLRKIICYAQNNGFLLYCRDLSRKKRKLLYKSGRTQAACDYSNFSCCLIRFDNNCLKNKEII